MFIGLDGNEANVTNRVGSGQYAYWMLKEFAKNKKHNFIVYLKEKPKIDLPKESINFKYKVFGPKKLWTQFALPIKLTLGKKPDIFFTLGHYGPRFSRVPYAITIFDLSYLHFPSLFNKDDLYQLTNWSRYSIKSAKHIFAISNSTKQDIIKNYKVTERNMTVTYMGYNKTLFKPQTKSMVETVEKKYRLIDDYIIFVGTIQPRKNLERLIEAFVKITPKFPRLKLVVVGRKGWQFEQIFTKVKEYRVSDKVIFTDYVPEQELPALIAGAKLYILPSLYEGFGIPVIEAQACGTPTLVSDTSSLPEVVEASGILVDPQSVSSIAKGIEKVLTNKQLSEDLIQRGFENIKRFSWQKCAQETISVLETMNG